MSRWMNVDCTNDFRTTRLLLSQLFRAILCFLFQVRRVSRYSRTNLITHQQKHKKERLLLFPPPSLFTLLYPAVLICLQKFSVT